MCNNIIYYSNSNNKERTIFPLLYMYCTYFYYCLFGGGWMNGSWWSERKFWFFIQTLMYELRENLNSNRVSIHFIVWKINRLFWTLKRFCSIRSLQSEFILLSGTAGHMWDDCGRNSLWKRGNHYPFESIGIVGWKILYYDNIESVGESFPGERIFPCNEFPPFTWMYLFSPYFQIKYVS